MAKYCPNFLYRLHIIFPFIPGCFSLISNGKNFFVHSLNRFVLKKKILMHWWFSSMQLSHMIPGVNIIGRKVSVASVNEAGGSGGSLRPQ